MFKVMSTTKINYKVQQLEGLLENHQRFQCKRGPYQAPETCALCSAWITSIRVVRE